MKKMIFSAAIILIAALIIPFTSCKDEFTERDALLLQYDLNDSLLRVGGIIRYSVSIVPVGGTAFLKSTEAATSPAGAVVTASQNGKEVSLTAGPSGIVIFEDMRIGNVSVTISLNGHCGVSCIVDLTPADGLTGFGGVNDGEGGIDLSHVVRNAATLVPMFPLSGDNLATVKGKATIQSNLTNKTTEVPTDAKITALLDVTSPAFNNFWEAYGGNFNNEGAGRIIKMAFTNAVFSTTVDANGNYSLMVPASGQPGVPIKLEVSDYQTNQTLLMNTVNGEPVFVPQQISTVWGQSIAASTIPIVPSAYVTVSEPVGAASMVTLNAQAIAYVDNSNGVSSINITNSGFGYSVPQGAFYTCVITQSGENNGASARAYIEAATGRVIRVEIASAGTNYTTAAILDIVRVRTPFSGQIVDTGGQITGVSIIEAGEYRVRPTNAIINTTGGTNGVIRPNWGWNGSTWSVVSFTILNPGTGYLTGQTITINPPSGSSDAQYQINLTTGSVTSIAVTNSGAGYYAAPEVVITGGGGNGATAVAHVDNITRKVDYITITNPGSGYTTAPTLQLVVRDNRIKGVIGLNINFGVVTVAAVTNVGQGYYQIPTLTVTPAISGFGTGAQLIASINQNTGVISGVTLLNGGSNYLGVNYPVGAGVNTNFPINVTAISGKTYVRDLNFGTGKRSVEN